MLNEILQPQIILSYPICIEEADYLCKQLEVAQLATNKFVAGEITYSDFLECLELAEVDIDKYQLTIGGNLAELGIVI
jgi:hypothetical protein